MTTPLFFRSIISMALLVMSAQAQVSISGTVLDSGMMAPVVGADVRLSGMNMATITDSAGKFSFSGTSIRQNRKSGNRVATGTVPATTIRIFDCCGRQCASFFPGTSASNYEKESFTLLSPGVYLYVVETAHSRRTVRFVASVNGSGIPDMPAHLAADVSHQSQSSAIKCGAVPQPVDSLLVTKKGYRQASFPIYTYQQEGLTILLTDTSSTVMKDITIIPDPSWTCFMPDGIPPPEGGEAVFTITLEYSAMHDVGITRFGYRRQYDIASGTIKGDRIDGSVLSGGLDYELTLANGSVELEQIIIFRVGSTPILMRNAGVTPTGAQHVRVVLDFEAPNSSAYTWLHTGKFAATRIIDTTSKKITLAVYAISNVALTEKRIEIRDPDDVPNQTWECFTMNGSKGDAVFTENVTLGSSISIGASKRGSRNIIPITGGTTSGKVTGTILPGGADYQLGGLDARYTLAPDDGEFIIVRNCGAGALIPVFEARVDGPYNFLNENKYLSSSPGVGTEGVTITFYERK